MLEQPDKNSTQNTLTFSLENTIPANELISLIDENNQEIVTFKASKSFKTIIISSSTLKNNSYYLYTSGTHSGTLKYGIYYNGKYTKGTKLTINNNSTFNLTETITSFK